MHDLILYIFAGAAVGFAVGMTGVGGGSLMTPLLLLFGFPPNIAVGTDLLYASLTKASGVISHQRQKNIEWHTVAWLSLGSIPASLITIALLAYFFKDAQAYEGLLTSSLGIMLILTALVLLFKRFIIKQAHSPQQATLSDQQKLYRIPLLTMFMGLILGIFVTLSSVGAGAFGTAVLLVLYPQLVSIKVVGTDIAHAVPLTMIAGLGHLYLGNVDFTLLFSLLLGSLPAIHFGAHFAKRLPDQWLQTLLASALLALGIKYAFL